MRNRDRLRSNDAHRQGTRTAAMPTRVAEVAACEAAAGAIDGWTEHSDVNSKCGDRSLRVHGASNDHRGYPLAREVAGGATNLLGARGSGAIVQLRCAVRQGNDVELRSPAR